MSDPVDALVQVAPDSTGAKIDNSEITRDDDDATVVYRQRVNISDPVIPGAHAGLARDQDGYALMTLDQESARATTEVLNQILTELRMIRSILGGS